jgi:hypothetical protein
MIAMSRRKLIGFCMLGLPATFVFFMMLRLVSLMPPGQIVAVGIVVALAGMFFGGLWLIAENK